MPTREEKILFIEKQMAAQAAAPLSREQKIAFIESKMSGGGDQSEAPKDKTNPDNSSRLEQFGRVAIDTILPVAGAVGGGLLAAPTAAVSGPVGPVAGAGLGYMGGKNLARVANSYLFGDELPKSYGEIATTAAGDLIEGATMEMGGQALNAGVKLAYEGGKKAVRAVTPSKFVEELIAVKPKANASDITAASKQLGIEPTPGMIQDSMAVQGLESSLSQSPSLAGSLVRKNTEKALKAIDGVSESALKDATPLGPYQVGEKVKAAISSKVNSKAETIGAVFEELKASTSNIALNPKSTERVAKNLLKIDDVALTPGSPWSAKAEKYGEWLQNAKSVDDIKKLRSLVGKEVEVAQGPERQVLGTIYDRLRRLEENSLVRGTIETMRGFARKPDGKTGDALAKEGEVVAGDMLKQMRGAKKDWSSLMGDLRELSSNSRLGKVQTPSQFVDKIENIPSERIGDKLFNTQDQRLLQTVQKQFPEEYALLRENEVADLARRSSDANGKVNSSRFLNNIKNVDDDQQKILFGDQFQSIKNAKTVRGALPEKIGPSGTPQGEMFRQSWNPMFQAQELARYGAYKTLSSDKVQAAAKMLRLRPEMAALEKSQPQAFKTAAITYARQAAGEKAPLKKAAENDEGPATRPLKGNEKWANDGLNKAIEAKPELEKFKGAMLSDPKAKAILISMSDLTPGSVRFQKAVAELEQLGRN